MYRTALCLSLARLARSPIPDPQSLVRYGSVVPRRPKNHRPDLNGLLVIDKPLGMSSAAVCRKVRYLGGGAKVGHAGTLDPLATGVLLVCLGAATKAIDALMATDKRYLADVDLSAFSTTDDMEGEATPVDVERPPSESAVREAVARFVGEIMQAPPAYSAVHVGGERAYKIARRAAATASAARNAPRDSVRARSGSDGSKDLRPELALGAPLGPELPPRPVHIHAIDILAYDFPNLRLDIRCGKGTYIRSLARDLGRALHTGGRLAALRRTAVGQFTVEHATPLDALPERIEPEHLLPIP